MHLCLYSLLGLWGRVGHGKMFRCLGLDSRAEWVLVGQSPVGGGSRGIAWRQVSHLLAGW